VRHNAAGSIYRLGLVLFDLHAPHICLKRCNEWIFSPDEPYEQRGDVDNVVFPCGYTIASDGDTIQLYYGAADTCIALATASINSLLKWLEQQSWWITCLSYTIWLVIAKPRKSLLYLQNPINSNHGCNACCNLSKQSGLF